jgi:tetratricopeptide (TPR) repeat protein
LDTLANILRQRYKRLGNVDDLRRAIDIGRKAIRHLPSGSDPTGDYQNLAYSLSLIYQLEGNPKDLDDAILLGLGSLKKPNIAPETFVDRSSNVADFYMAKFARSGDTDDLEEALAVLRRASAVLPPNSSRQIRISTVIAFCLRNSYMANNRFEDLETAIEVAKNAVGVPDHSLYAKSYLNNELGNLFVLRYGRLSLEGDSSEALRYYTAAASLCPRDDPALLSILGNISDV